MKREEVITGFLVLKEILSKLTSKEKTVLFDKSAAVNPWYTPENIQRAVDGLIYMLDEVKLRAWASNYPEAAQPVNVGLIMAGNIPLVGFHDLLSVLAAGHRAQVKLSSQDEVLPKFIISELTQINPAFNQQIEVVDKLSNIGAVIATGSDNSSRYFRKYFKEYPHIIRKNRTSVAILEGNESAAELEGLGDDIFSYFGMGCRNVAKIYVPTGYDLTYLIDQFDPQASIANHPKYFNNYEYNKAIYLVNKVDHLDNGFALFTESPELVSPLSVVYYQFYQSIEEVEAQLNGLDEKLQCVVSKVNLDRQVVPFGWAQRPELEDYADGVDTMKFLTKL